MVKAFEERHADWHMLFQTVNFLLEAGANVNQVGGIYHTALQIAARAGNLALVALLLNKGAKIDLKGGRYGTALQAAAYRGMESVVVFLLDAGADVYQTGGIYHTALQAAAFRGHEATVKLLLERKAEVNIDGGRYHNALRAARQTVSGNCKIVEKILIGSGATDSFDPAVEMGGSKDEKMFETSVGFPDLSDW
jgi:ankyrin repeat protein